MSDSEIKKKVVITGACGRVGKYALRELVKHGHEVTGVDLVSEDLGVTVKQADLESLDEALWALERAEVVVHFAAISELSKGAMHKIFRVNAVSTCNVFEAARILGIRRVIFASSCSVYGFHNAINYAAPKYFPVDEEHPLLGQDCYALSKTVGEETARMYNRLLGIDAICLRIPWAILPEFYSEKFLDVVFGNPDKIAMRHLWGYCDVRDLAQATCLAVAHQNPLGFTAFNVMADTNARAPESTISLIRSYFPDVPIDESRLQGDITAYDNSKIKRILGFKPKHTLRMHANVDKWMRSRCIKVAR